ncbi:hypothetical protein ACIPCF_08020 [Paracoccus marcusii]|uniref:hypothetical protein n=1 Tax=Paracoccus marcusii TaxID=59779 RepID=UPI0038B844D7
MTDDSGNRATFWVGAFTIVGVIIGGVIDKVSFDANTRLETNVQLIELAIGILAAPSPEAVFSKDGAAQAGIGATRDIALRTWAVDTINTAAEVKFDGAARSQLIDGTSNLPAWSSAGAQSYLKLLSAWGNVEGGTAQAQAEEVHRRIDELSDQEVERALRGRANQPPGETTTP